MPVKSKRPTAHSFEETAARAARAEEAVHLQHMEGNPFDAEDEAMFAMFERKGWSHEQRRAYIAARAKGLVAPKAAE